MTTEPTYTEFSDPRLVAIYDTVNPLGAEKAFYLDLADQLHARTIIDLGCGTGLLTLELANHGRHLIGVEPSALMLEGAKHRLAGQNVELIRGGAPQLGHHQADLAVMTGHVAQFFLTDAEWRAALTSLHQALEPGAYLAFESRNPLVTPYTKWPTSASHRRLHDPQAGDIEWWSQDLTFDGHRARYEIHYLFTGTGEKIISHNELIFRSRAQITISLQAAGFAVEHVYGNWDATPATDATPEMIFVAKRS